MNNDKNQHKNTQPYAEDEIQTKQQKEAIHDVYKIIIDVVGSALERPVGKQTTTGEFKTVIEESQTLVLSPHEFHEEHRKRPSVTNQETNLSMERNNKNEYKMQ